MLTWKHEKRSIPFCYQTRVNSTSQSRTLLRLISWSEDWRWLYQLGFQQDKAPISYQFLIFISKSNLETSIVIKKKTSTTSWLLGINHQKSMKEDLPSGPGQIRSVLHPEVWQHDNRTAKYRYIWYMCGHGMYNEHPWLSVQLRPRLVEQQSTTFSDLMLACTETTHVSNIPTV